MANYSNAGIHASGGKARTLVQADTVEYTINEWMLSNAAGDERLRWDRAVGSGALILGDDVKLMFGGDTDVMAQGTAADGDWHLFHDNASTGALLVTDKANDRSHLSILTTGITFGNATDASGSTHTFHGDVTITQDLLVQGTEFISVSEQVVYNDNLLHLNANPAATSIDGGILVERYYTNWGAADETGTDELTAVEGTGASFTHAAASGAATNKYRDWSVVLTSGTGAGQTRTITASVAESGGAVAFTVDRSWDTNPDNTTDYSLFQTPNRFGAFYWDETGKEFVLGMVTAETASGVDIGDLSSNAASLRIAGALDVDSTLNVDSTSTLVGVATFTADAQFNGGLSVADGQSIAVGTSDDLTIIHANGADTTISHQGEGDLIIDQTLSDKDIIFRLGDDLVGSVWRVQNNTASGNKLSVTGSGVITFGEAATDLINFTAEVNSAIIPNANENLGADTVAGEWGTVYAQTFTCNDAGANEYIKLGKDGAGTTTGVALHFPIFTTANRDTALTSPVEGLVLYNSTTDRIEYYSTATASWEAGGAAADGTNSLTFTVNQDHDQTTEDEDPQFCWGGDDGTNNVRGYVTLDSTADLLHLWVEQDTAHNDSYANVAPTFQIGKVGEAGNLDPILQFAGSSATWAWTYDSSEDTLKAGGEIWFDDGQANYALSFGGSTASPSGYISWNADANALSLAQDALWGEFLDVNTARTVFQGRVMLSTDTSDTLADTSGAPISLADNMGGLAVFAESSTATPTNGLHAISANLDSDTGTGMSSGLQICFVANVNSAAADTGGTYIGYMAKTPLGAGASTMTAISVASGWDNALDIDGGTIDIVGSSYSAAHTGDVGVTTTSTASSAYAVTVNGGTSSLLTLTNSSGTAANALDINATLGGIDVDALLGVTITNNGTAAQAATGVTVNTAAKTAADGTGGITLATGAVSGANATGASGALGFSTGATVDGASGSIGLSTGDVSDDGNSGAITIEVGSVTNGSVGAITIGGDAVNGAVNIATAGTRTLSIGSATADLVGNSGAAASGWTHASTSNAHDFLLQVTGANDASLQLWSAGTGSDALHLDASAGTMKLDAYLGFDMNTDAVAGGSGAYTFDTGNASAGVSGGFTFLTGTGTTSTGAYSLTSGNASAGTSGALTLASGTGTSATGKLDLDTGNATAGTSGDVDITTGTGTTATGGFDLDTGNASAGSSGGFAFDTGTAAGAAGASGGFAFTSGTSADGATGGFSVVTGAASGTDAADDSGGFTFTTGTAGLAADGAGSSGSFAFTTGNQGNGAGTGGSGGFTFTTGTADTAANRGGFTVDAYDVTHTVANNYLATVTGTWTGTITGAYLVNGASTVGIQGASTISIGTDTADTSRNIVIGHGTSNDSALLDLNAGTGGFDCDTGVTTASTTSGAYAFNTGNITSGTTGGTGGFNFASGTVDAGSGGSGGWSVDSGNSSGTGSSGGFAWTSGTSAAAVTGGFAFTSGAALGGNSGGFTFTSGTSDSTRGSFTVDAYNATHTLANNYLATVLGSWTGTITGNATMDSAAALSLQGATSVSIATTDNVTTTIGSNAGASALVVDVGTGGITMDTNDGGAISLDAIGAPSNVTLTATANADDLTVSVAGAFDASLILASSGTSATDAIQVNATAGGILFNIDGTGTAAFRVDCEGAIVLESAAEAASWTQAASGAGDDLLLDVTGNTDSSVHLRSAGSGADAIRIETVTNGGSIDINSNAAITVDAATSYNLVTAAGAIDLDATGGDIKMDVDDNRATAFQVEQAGTAYLTVSTSTDSASTGVCDYVAANEMLQLTSGKGIGSVWQVADGVTLAVGDVVTRGWDATNTAVRLFKADADSGTEALQFPNAGVVTSLLGGTGSGASNEYVKFLATGSAPVKMATEGAPAAADNGKPVYLSATAGEGVLTAPTASGSDVVRIGFLVGGNGASTAPAVAIQKQYIRTNA